MPATATKGKNAKFSYDYDTLLNFAVNKIKSEHKSVLAFATEARIKKRSGGYYDKLHICNLLSIPSEGKKVVKSTYFLRELFLLWDINLDIKKVYSLTTEIVSDRLIA